MKALDKFIEENGFRGSQSVKVGYDSLKEFINQRVIEELEKQVNEYFKQPTEIDLSKRLKDRIQELKQE
tara:strand:- start:26 stop:232 length:207 start_codon:yes stop_codon:yes gene_type:complete